MVSVCFVCLGNICRSPTAEGVMRHLVKRAGLANRIAVDSAGTAAFHAGEAPDRRSRAVARTRGIDVSGRARQFRRTDWDRFHYVLAMDRENYQDLLTIASDRSVEGKLFMLRAFDPGSGPDQSVPDPYYGGPHGFDRVLDLCEDACQGLLAHIRREHRI
jgi:protein-tyrosine phosphatase